MTPEEIREYANRDWALLERYKLSYRSEQKASMTPAKVVRLADDLRVHIQQLRPDWPAAAEREADFEAPIRLSEKLNASRNRNR